ncbi:MAG: Inositol-1-monophosphatase ImpA [Opitutia bacterium UBA7350]|nr:MAG: Inositol-1-monophosphatase ImpA [Opitutae bacterium UBA7350]
MSGNRQAHARQATQLRQRIHAGREAIKRQIGFFARQFGEVPSEWKADDTRVTFADFAISEQVAMCLRRDFPEDDFCSEESGPMDEDQILEAPFAWVLDPIDGTNNYALGFPACAISLALLYEGLPVYGFLYEHMTGSILEGGAAHGLFRERKRLDRHVLAAEAQAMLGLHFPMPAKQLRLLEPLLSRYRVRCLGSGALTMAQVATGYLSGAIDFRVKVWDLAAAYALCGASEVRIQFTEASPFPLKRFNPQMEFSPYYAGTEAFIAEIESCFNES